MSDGADNGQYVWGGGGGLNYIKIILKSVQTIIPNHLNVAGVGWWGQWGLKV